MDLVDGLGRHVHRHAVRAPHGEVQGCEHGAPRLQGDGVRRKELGGAQHRQLPDQKLSVVSGSVGRLGAHGSPGEGARGGREGAHSGASREAGVRGRRSERAHILASNPEAAVGEQGVSGESVLPARLLGHPGGALRGDNGQEPPGQGG